MDTGEWDEAALVRETFGRATYNFSGGTRIGPIYQGSASGPCVTSVADNEMDVDYP